MRKECSCRNCEYAWAQEDFWHDNHGWCLQTASYVPDILQMRKLRQIVCHWFSGTKHVGKNQSLRLEEVLSMEKQNWEEIGSEVDVNQGELVIFVSIIVMSLSVMLFSPSFLTVLSRQPVQAWSISSSATGQTEFLISPARIQVTL